MADLLSRITISSTLINFVVKRHTLRPSLCYEDVNHILGSVKRLFTLTCIYPANVKKIVVHSIV